MGNYSHFAEKYSYYHEITDRIYNIASYDCDLVVSFILEQYEKYNFELNAIYKMIAKFCMYNIAHIREYWELYDKIVQQTNFKPIVYDSRLIIEALYAKKYNIDIDWWGETYLCKNISFEEIINFYDSDPILQCIIHDDIKKFKEIIDSSYSFDLNQTIFGITLIQNCCFCGAVECFKFLRSNNIKIDSYCLEYSITGGNNSIINECLQFFEPSRHIISKIINLDTAISFQYLYNLDIPLEDILDLRLFLYLLSVTKNYDKFLINCVKFGIPSLIEDILQLGANIVKCCKI